MIDANQGIITMGSQGELGGMSLPMKKHLELEIKILQNAPRDADKLEKLLQIRQRQKEEAMYIEDTQRLVTEIEMLKVVLHLVCCKDRESEREGREGKEEERELILRSSGPSDI